MSSTLPSASKGWHLRSLGPRRACTECCLNKGTRAWTTSPQSSRRSAKSSAWSSRRTRSEPHKDIRQPEALVDISLGKLEHLDPRTLWKNEAGDFTPWLADNLPMLGEALGLDLQLEEMEGPVGDFSCDIVAREVGTNRPVIIENQLERTDHSHLGQLLTYAAGLDAGVVIWISSDIREEHREALHWLNRHTDEQIDFFGIRLEAVRIDGSKPAIQFSLVVSPNKWGKAQSRKAAKIITGSSIPALKAH